MGIFRSVNVPLTDNPSQADGVSLYLSQKAQMGTPYLPISGGNLYEQNMHLHLISRQYNLYYVLYLNERMYFTNLYKVEGCDELAKIWDGITKTVFDYGQCAVKKMGGLYVPFQIAKLEFKSFNEIKEAEGVIVSPTAGIFDISKVTKVPLKPEDTVFIKSNYNAYPALLFWQFALKTFVDYICVNNTNLIWLPKKAVWTVRNGSSERIAKELGSLLDINTPYAIINNGIRDGERDTGDNKLEILNTPSNTQTEFWHSFRECQSYWYQHLGRRHNTSFKKERNVSSETEIADACFDNLEYEAYKYLEQFIKEWNKKFGFNAKLVKIAQDQENHADEEQDKKLIKEMEGKPHYDNNK